MLFSFVLPAYKRKYFHEAISSILNQTYREFELIIVDDASPECLKEVVNQFDDDRIRYYKNVENIGGKDLVAQWNHSLTYATGDYVILASDDDVYEPGFLEAFVALIEKYPDVNLFRARSFFIDSNGRLVALDAYYKEYIPADEFKYIWFNGIKGGIANYIFKRERLLAIGGFVNFPLAWGSDTATTLAMADYGMVNSKEHLFSFRYSGENITTKGGPTLIPKLKARIMLNDTIRNLKIDDSSDSIVLFFKKHIEESIERKCYDNVWSIIKYMKTCQRFQSLLIIQKDNCLSKRYKIKLALDILYDVIATPFVTIETLLHRAFNATIKLFV